MSDDLNSPETSTPDTVTSQAETSAEPAATAAVELAPSFGWTAYAERINGRFAMVGFVALLVLQWITRQDFFTWLGF